MIFEKREEGKAILFCGGRMAEVEPHPPNGLLLRWHQEAETDVTMTLRDLGVLVASVVGAGPDAVSMIHYPESVIVASESMDSGRMFSELEKYCQESVSGFCAHVQHPLHALLSTLLRCGEKRLHLAEKLGLSPARISTVLTNPNCSATSKTISKIRSYVKKCYSSLVPLVECADSRSRSELGELYFRG